MPGGQAIGGQLIVSGATHFLQTTSNVINQGMSWEAGSNAAGISLQVGGSFTPQWGMGNQQVPNTGLFQNNYQYQNNGNKSYDGIMLAQNGKRGVYSDATEERVGGGSSWFTSLQGSSRSDSGWEQFYDPSSLNGLAKGPNLLLNTTGFWLSAAGGGVAMMGLARGMTLAKLSYSILDIAINTSGAISSLNGMTSSLTRSGSPFFYKNDVVDAGIGLTGAWNSSLNGFGSFRVNNAATIGFNLFSIGLGVKQSYK